MRVTFSLRWGPEEHDGPRTAQALAKTDQTLNRKQ